MYEFRSVLESENELTLRRGSFLSGLFAFDVHKVSSMLSIALEPSGEGTRITAVLKASAPFSVFTNSDRQVLEKDLDVLIETLR